MDEPLVRTPAGTDHSSGDALPLGLSAALNPTSIAIVGASEDPDKVGGRPLAYLARFGYRGRVYPVNPRRATVQGQRAYPSLVDLPESPDLVIVAVPGEQACTAIEEAAALRVRVAVVMASGFAESGEAGRSAERRMLEQARAAGMRIVGPNSQGLANFGTGAIASFSTMFTEVEPADGPIAIVSQSGIMSVFPYGLLRERGLGVRHAHATGNSADVTVAELAGAVLLDPAVELLLLYMESIPDPGTLERAADLARRRDVPIVALKSGRTRAGQAAARSHSAALANEDRVVDAFLRRVGIWRARDTQEWVRCTELYLKGWRPRGRRLTVVSNSGATCVMAADAADALQLPLAPLEEDTRRVMKTHLPGFASATNPIDVTAALLGNPSLFGHVLSAVTSDATTDLVFVGIPVAGRGYDVEAFAQASAACARVKPLVVAAPQPGVARRFREAGVPVFGYESEALASLNQFVSHAELRWRRRAAPWARVAVASPGRGARFLNEAESLAWLGAYGFPVVGHRLCRTGEDVREAFRALGGPVVAKGCAAQVPHKSDHGLVVLNLADEDAAVAAAQGLLERLAGLGVEADGVLIASMVRGRHEFQLGAHVDGVFGPVVTVGDGGARVEAMDDTAVLLPPFEASEVETALRRLRMAPLIDGGRGEPPLDVGALARLAVRVGQVIASAGGEIASIDMNPVVVGAAGEHAVVVDALVERAHATT